MLPKIFSKTQLSVTNKLLIVGKDIDLFIDNITNFHFVDAGKAIFDILKLCSTK
jgi:hypothetical protein